MFDYIIVFSLIVMSIIGLVAVSDIFVNAVENLAERLNISESAAGSIFAAIGTALPETIIPFVAIFGVMAANLPIPELIHTNEYNIAVGAILGAPLMLSTLAFALIGIASLTRTENKGIIAFNDNTVKRDLTVFLIGITILVIAVLSENRIIQMSLGLILVLTYITYLIITLSETREDDDEDDDLEPLRLNSIVKMENRLAAISIQMLVSVLLVIGAAKMLIYGINMLTELVQHSGYISEETMHSIAFIIALFIIPVATELPEKINSFIWVRKNKDHMALGNITGAMTFQTTMIPGLFMLIVPFYCDLLSHHGGTILITAFMASMLLFISRKAHVKWPVLICFAVPYLTFSFAVFYI